MNIWILNHTATPPSMGGLVRHYYFSKYLTAMGHEVKLFTSSMVHNTKINMITGKELYKQQVVDGVAYTFVRSRSYQGNGLARIWGMLEFPVRLWKTCNRFPLPDLIYTSSPDLFTAFAALLYARRKKIPCVVEVRDLWPESIVEYRGMSRKNPIIWTLYQLEKWIYKHANQLIFTMEGGPDYIRERGLDSVVDTSKIHNVNNGVDLAEFEQNREEYALDDADLANPDIFKVAYTGSIRLVNDLGMVLHAAKLLKQQGHHHIKFLIWGQGGELEPLKQQAAMQGLTNICFKGFVEKKYIASILSKADLNFIHVRSTPIMRFGASLNKLFEYMAAGKPILWDFPCNYGLVERYNCGLSLNEQDPQKIADSIWKISQMSVSQREEMGARAQAAAKEYDFLRLTEKLENVLKDAVK